MRRRTPPCRPPGPHIQAQVMNSVNIPVRGMPALENWTLRELRRSYVSIMSDNGVTIEQIADLVGHRTTIVTQKVYRHQLKPVISTGATAMKTIFGNKKTA